MIRNPTERQKHYGYCTQFNVALEFMMNDAYKQFFGTKEQPNKPVRATIQAAALVVPNALVEIEVVAVRSK